MAECGEACLGISSGSPFLFEGSQGNLFPSDSTPLEQVASYEAFSHIQPLLARVYTSYLGLIALSERRSENVSRKRCLHGKQTGRGLLLCLQYHTQGRMGQSYVECKKPRHKHSGRYG